MNHNEKVHVSHVIMITMDDNFFSTSLLIFNDHLNRAPHGVSYSIEDYYCLLIEIYSLCALLYGGGWMGWNLRKGEEM